MTAASMMLNLRSAILALPILLSLSLPLPAHADTKVMTAEGTYTMGDGETPSFAEAMALQKAKQTALEQAGTYIESYTKVQNYQLTAEEIQTIAGGVLQVEVLEKTRTLIGDGLRHYVKIKAAVTTDKVAELAHRIKGKNVAEEYKKLQQEYARLSKEIETWKQLVVKTPDGPERDKALDQMREQEQTVLEIIMTQRLVVERLLSGETLVAAAKNEEDELALFALKLLHLGPKVALGEVKAMPKGSRTLNVSIPLTLSISDNLLPDLTWAVRRYRGWIEKLPHYAVVVVSLFDDPSEKPKRQYFWKFFYDMSLLIHIEFSDGVVRTCRLAGNQTREGLEVLGKPVFLDDFAFSGRNAHSEWITLHVDDFPLPFFVLDVKDELLSRKEDHLAFLGHVPTDPNSNTLTFVLRTTPRRITAHFSDSAERVKAIRRVTAEFAFHDQNKPCQFD